MLPIYLTSSTIATSATVSDILEQAGDTVTHTLGWVQNVAATITNTPLLMFTIGFLVLGVSVGFVSRLLRR